MLKLFLHMEELVHQVFLQEHQETQEHLMHELLLKEGINLYLAGHCSAGGGLVVRLVAMVWYGVGSGDGLCCVVFGVVFCLVFCLVVLVLT